AAIPIIARCLPSGDNEASLTVSGCRKASRAGSLCPNENRAAWACAHPSASAASANVRIRLVTSFLPMPGDFLARSHCPRAAARPRFVSARRLHHHLQPLLPLELVDAEPVGDAHAFGHRLRVAEPDRVAQLARVAHAQLQVLLADQALLHHVDLVAE